MKISLMPFFLGFGLWAFSLQATSLSNVQKIATDTMKAASDRMRVTAENMANAKSADYVPKQIEFQAKRDRKRGVDTVGVKKIKSNRRRMKKVYDPHHPKANEKGYVTMPDINQMVELMNMQESKHDTERALKTYQVATELRHKTIRLMNGQ